jgi:hypothetical protein
MNIAKKGLPFARQPTKQEHLRIKPVPLQARPLPLHAGVPHGNQPAFQKNEVSE